MTAIAAKEGAAADQPATSLPPEANPPQQPQQQPDNPIMAEQPQIAAMSALKKRIAFVEADRIAESSKRLSERLQALLTSGRCFPAELNTKKSQLQVQKLSVGIPQCRKCHGSQELES